MDLPPWYESLPIATYNGHNHSATRENNVNHPTAKTGRLYQHVAEQLMRTIVGGTYKVGDRLPPERELAVAFDVSRPTIREAIIALEVDGMVDVKMGSGVYVKSVTALDAAGAPRDIGPFELTEARLLFESEAAALAATLITDEEIGELDRLLIEMKDGNRRGIGELADRKFHQRIADATRNSAISGVIDSLWEIRLRSPQCIRLFEKTRAKGYLPALDEHRPIVDALRRRDAQGARNAMQRHLRSVLEQALDATEVEAIEEAKGRIAIQRRRFGTRGRR
jgi:GntR family transcriptional repressor for pyruvate dehydrogenase complex